MCWSVSPHVDSLELLSQGGGSFLLLLVYTSSPCSHQDTWGFFCGQPFFSPVFTFQRASFHWLHEIVQIGGPCLFFLQKPNAWVIFPFNFNSSTNYADCRGSIPAKVGFWVGLRIFRMCLPPLNLLTQFQKRNFRVQKRGCSRQKYPESAPFFVFGVF